MKQGFTYKIKIECLCKGFRHAQFSCILKLRKDIAGANALVWQPIGKGSASSLAAQRARLLRLSSHSSFP
jgi:hypothetical protein